MRQDRSRFQRGRRPALLGAGLLAAMAAGVLIAVAFGLGREERPPASPTQAQTPGPTPTAAAPAMRVARTFTVGRRPNIVRVVGDNVFVSSFQRDRVTILSAKTGDKRSHAPLVGFGVGDAAVGFGSVWFPAQRANQLARVDARTGRLRGAPLKLPGEPGAVAVSPDAVWLAITNKNGVPDLLLKLDPQSGETLATVQYPYGIMSIATSPGSIWTLARRRSLLQRADPDTGQVVENRQYARDPGADIEYRSGALWIASARDDVVYKLIIKTREVIPIAVGRRPRQLAIGNGHVYVTNYDSSELYAIDEKRARIDGHPLGVAVNPFGVDVAGDGAVWVASQPDNRLSQVVTGRDG